MTARGSAGRDAFPSSVYGTLPGTVPKCVPLFISLSGRFLAFPDNGHHRESSLAGRRSAVRRPVCSPARGLGVSEVDRTAECRPCNLHEGDGPGQRGPTEPGTTPHHTGTRLGSPGHG
jgi:hypothetical protein